MKYENIFKKSLLREEPVPVSPQDQVQAPPQDSDVWANQNPEIAGNPDLSKQFDVQGLDKQEIEKYSEKIRSWGEGIKGAMAQLAEMIKFATSEKLSAAPGSEQFTQIVKIAPKLKSELSSFQSQVEDLGETVKLAINDASKERKEKLNDLRA